jgi:hypothetical protein
MREIFKLSRTEALAFFIIYLIIWISLMGSKKNSSLLKLIYIRWKLSLTDPYINFERILFLKSTFTSEIKIIFHFDLSQ